MPIKEYIPFNLNALMDTIRACGYFPDSLFYRKLTLNQSSLTNEERSAILDGLAELCRQQGVSTEEIIDFECSPLVSQIIVAIAQHLPPAEGVKVNE